MRALVRAELVLSCILLLACGADDDASMNTAGEGGAGTTSGARSGSSGSSDNTGNAGNAGHSETCYALADEAYRAVSSAVEDADLGCDETSDCEHVSIDSECHASCGALVATQDEAAVEAAIAEQNATTCVSFAAMGCVRVIPPCVPPQSFACVQQRCTWLDGELPDGAPMGQDAGRDASSDAATSTENCVDQTLRWGNSGGRVAWEIRYVLEPCRAYRAERMDFGVGTEPEEVCNNEVPLDDLIGVDDVDAAIAHPDVQAAIAEAPVLYGYDGRVLDAPVFLIDIGGAMIEVGGECGPNTPCTDEIPEGVGALKSLLQALDAQQRGVVPNCTGTS